MSASAAKNLDNIAAILHKKDDGLLVQNACAIVFHIGTIYVIVYLTWNVSIQVRIHSIWNDHELEKNIILFASMSICLTMMLFSAVIEKTC